MDARRPPGQTVSIDRASELLGVCRRTVYYMLGDGRLVSIRTLNGSQRVLLDSIAFGALKARPVNGH